ncbi:MAG: hypothetical protein MPI47_08490, partial [Cuniculiplasma sp.]|nr:hypothetical protein [Cuniculiplasma sp.]
KIFFSGNEALKYGKTVKYFTERCVFDLTQKGLCITEVPEGIDIDKDIIEKMEFKPEVSRDIKKMPEIVFGTQEMERRDIETWATEI